MRVAELRHELQSRGLETDGTKVILVSRLQYAIEQEKRDSIQLVIEQEQNSESDNEQSVVQETIALQIEPVSTVQNTDPIDPGKM